jgi:hypothetical protein
MAKLAIARSTARVIPTTRAQVRPDSSPQAGANATTSPMIRWTQPQVVASNWNRQLRVAAYRAITPYAVARHRGGARGDW